MANNLDEYLDYVARLFPGQYGQSTSAALAGGSNMAPGQPAPMLPAPTTVGSIPGGARAQAPQAPQQAPMDAAMDPSVLGRVMRGVDAFDPKDALSNAGAWLIAGSNPAGGAALLAAHKKDKTGEWSHQIDPNTGQVISVHNKDGRVMATPIPGFNRNKALEEVLAKKDASIDEARAKKEADADVELDTKLGEFGSTLARKRQDLNTAMKTFKDLPEDGLWNSDQGVAAQRLANTMGIPGFEKLPQVEKAKALAVKMALEYNAPGASGMRVMPGSESNQEGQRLLQIQASPEKTKAANMELLGIAHNGLRRDEEAYKIHQAMTGNKFTRKAYYDALSELDRKRAETKSGYPTGFKSIQQVTP